MQLKEKNYLFYTNSFVLSGKIFPLRISDMFQSKEYVLNGQAKGNTQRTESKKQRPESNKQK